MRSWLLSSAKILPKRVDKLLAVLDDEEVDTFDHLRVFAGKIGGACDKLLTETTVGMIRAALACDAGALQVPLSPVPRTPERRLPPMDTSVSIGAAETPGGEEIAPPPAPRKLDIQPRSSSSRRLLDPTTGVARDFAATRLQAATRRFLAIGATLRLQAHTLSHARRVDAFVRDRDAGALRKYLNAWRGELQRANDNDKTKINTPCAPPSDAADAAVESTDDSALPSDGGSRGAGLNDEVGPAESLQIQHGTAPEMPPEPPPAGAKSGSAPSSPASAAERPLVGNPASASSFPQQHDAWQRWKQEHARRGELQRANEERHAVKIQAAWRGFDARWMRDTDECGDLWLRRTLDIMSVEQKLAARCIQRRWRAQQYQRYLDGVPLKTQWRAADKIQGEWREYYYDRSYYFYDMWGNLRRFENHLDAQGNYVGPDAWYFRARAESALQIQAAWRAWPGPLIPSWFWATNKTNNICEESTDASASTDALRAVEMTNEINLTKPQQAVIPDVIAYANSAEDAAETEDDYYCEIEDGLERGA